jgi:hypothetical protein
MKNKIELTLPIEIKPTINKDGIQDGYVITDANDTEHFFYKKDAESNELVYDGRCTTVKQKT